MLNQEFTYLTKKSKLKKKIIIHIQTISANSHVKEYFKSYNIKYFSKIKKKTVHNKTFRPHLRYIFGISDNMTQHFWNVKSTFCQSYHITSFK